MPEPLTNLALTLHNALLGLPFRYYDIAARRPGDDEIAAPGTDIVDKAAKSAITIFTIVMVFIGLMIALYVGLKIWNEFNTKNLKSEGEDNLAKAKKYEKKGEYNLAASYYERLNDFDKALALYQQGKDFSRAGALYETMKQYDKALSMYKKAGDSHKIAGLLMKNGNYAEAAKLFKSKGDTLRAAQAFEMMGNRAAAAREYLAGGKYIKAAQLYKDENMFLEAGQAFFRSIGGEDMSKDNLDKYFTYAAFMLMAEQTQTATEIYRRIHAIDPEFKDVARKLRLLEGGPEEEEAPAAAPVEEAAPEAPSGEEIAAQAPAPPPPLPAKKVEVMQQDDIDDLFAVVTAQKAEEDAQAEEVPANEGESPLRSLIQAGKLDPKYSLRIWMQMLKLMDQAHSSGKYLGSLSPDTVFIDMQNNIRLAAQNKPKAPYAAPEVLDGAAADAQTDIYSMGVILYEMVTGSTETIGKKYPIDIVKDLPEWLDGLIMKCMENERPARYRGTDEVSAIVLQKAYQW